MRLKLDLDEQTTEQLVKSAMAERRPIPWQAEILLQRALGLKTDPCDELPPESKEAAPCCKK